MDTVMLIIEMLKQDYMAQILLALLALSEALAAVPALKANSILQLVAQILRKLTGK